MEQAVIHDQLIREGEALADRARTFLAHHLHHEQKGTAVSIIDDIRAEITNAENKAAEVYNHAKTALEQHLPGIEAEVAKLENEPFVKAYLGTQLAVPEHLVNAALSILTALVQSGPAAPAAPADPALAEAPAAEAEPLPAQ